MKGFVRRGLNISAKMMALCITPDGKSCLGPLKRKRNR